MGAGNDAGVGGHQPHHTLARQRIEEGEDSAYGERPDEEDAVGTAEVKGVTRADETPRQRLGSIGKTVDEVAEKHKQLHHDGADGKGAVAIPRRERSEAHIDHHEAERTNEQIAVKHE